MIKKRGSWRLPIWGNRKFKNKCSLRLYSVANIAGLPSKMCSRFYGMDGWTLAILKEWPIIRFGEI